MANAVGTVKGFANCTRSICLMLAQAVANNPPTAATDGVQNYPDNNTLNAATGASFQGLPAVDSTLFIKATGTGTIVGTFTLWGYHTASDAWYPLAVNATSAAPKTPVALAETAVDVIRYTEKFRNLGHYDRLYLELVSPGGTTPAFEAWLTTGTEGRN